MVTIVDGDIIDVQLEGRTVRVRYIGINTPETQHPKEGVEPFGQEAKEANRRLWGPCVMALTFFRMRARLLTAQDPRPG